MHIHRSLNSLFLLFFIGLNPGLESKANDWTLEQLLQDLAEVKEISGEFTEYRRSVFLTEEIELTGTLTFQSPDKLEKITRKPVKEKLKIKGDVVSLSKQGEIPKRFSLTSDPAIAGAAAGIRATLQGNADELRKFYRVNLFGEQKAWTLHLLPLEAGLQEYVEQIKIHGRDQFITRVELTDAEGDENDINIEYSESTGS